MKHYFLSKNSDSLLLFFAGWGCDEEEFKHLKINNDLLILYEYDNLNLYFDFSKYKKINLLAFSAGVFISSVFKHDLKINKSLAVGGNPYLFDNHFGLRKDILKIFRNITEENCDAFIKKYIIKTEEEIKLFNGGKRSLESCHLELDSLEKIYGEEKENIKWNFDKVIFGSDDTIFNIEAQKEFYKDKLIIEQNAKHNIFFRIKSYEDLFNKAGLSL